MSLDPQTPQSSCIIPAMKLIDEKFKQDPKHYILQTLLAFVAVAVIVTVFGVLTSGVIVAALGASAFVVFATPHSSTARPRNVIGGHVLCMAIGLLCSIPFRFDLLAFNEHTAGILGAAAVALSIFVMVVTDSEHPPAAGNALAFTITTVDFEHILFTLGAVIALSLIRYGLRNWLRDLT